MSSEFLQVTVKQLVADSTPQQLAEKLIKAGALLAEFNQEQLSTLWVYEVFSDKVYEYFERKV